jgi:predicted ribonuclease YlaK
MLTEESVNRYMRGRMIVKVRVLSDRVQLTMIDGLRVVIKTVKGKQKIAIFRKPEKKPMQQHDVDKINDGIEYLNERLRELFPTGKWDADGVVTSTSRYPIKGEPDEFQRKKSRQKRQDVRRK